MLLIGLLVYAQGAIALAACGMERGAPAQQVEATCEHHEAQSIAAHDNLCAAHCTADLQVPAAPVALAPPAPAAPVLIVPAAAQPVLPRDARPWSGPPPRILLHSFLI